MFLNFYLELFLVNLNLELLQQELNKLADCISLDLIGMKLVRLAVYFEVGKLRKRHVVHLVSRS